MRLVRSAWELCGARVLRLDAAEHDGIFAAVSHLPHVVAYALVNVLARRKNARQLFGFSAGGLRDTVRIAGSSPEMWTDICIANRDLLLEALRRLRGRARAGAQGDCARRRGTVARACSRARAARARSGS